MAEKGCLYSIAVIMGIAVYAEVGWSIGSDPLAIILGIATAIGIGWYFSSGNKPDKP